MSNINITTYKDRVKANPTKFAKEISQQKLEEFLEQCNNHYYNNTSIISDDQYDILLEFVKENYPLSKILTGIGSEVDDVITKTKVTLPIFLGSMEKIKNDSNSLLKWCKKFTNIKVLSDKLDGISLLIEEKNGILQAYTRGNGTIGQNISWILKYINIGTDLKNAMIRGELIISKSNWHIVKKQYSEFSNPRNFVSGIVSRKSVDNVLIKLIDFVGYEYIKFKGLCSSTEQLENIVKCGYKCVYNITNSNPNNESVSQMLQNRRENGEYEIDGIIVTDNGEYPRPKKNPDYAKAFKMVIQDQCVETLVKDIIWTPSMYGVLKPVVDLVTITIDGVNINRVTGNNANFILNNTIGGTIGPGCKILMTRSGGVIPKILKVIVPYNDDIKNCLPVSSYKWNDTKIDIILTEPLNNDTVVKKRLEHFFKSININYLKSGLIQKLYDNKYDTVKKILKMDVDSLLSVDGIQKTLAEKLYKEIVTKYKECKLVDIMTGSLIFPGIGKITLGLIIDKYSDDFILSYIQSNIKLYAEKLYIIKGIGNDTVNKFLHNLPDFIEFFNSIK